MLTRAQVKPGMEVVVRKRPSEINGHTYTGRPWQGTIAKDSTGDQPMIGYDKTGKAIGVSVHRRPSGAYHFALWDELFDPADRTLRSQEIPMKGGDVMARGHGTVEVDGTAYRTLNAAGTAIYPKLSKRGSTAWMSYLQNHGHNVTFTDGTPAKLKNSTPAKAASTTPARARKDRKAAPRRRRKHKAKK